MPLPLFLLSPNPKRTRRLAGLVVLFILVVWGSILWQRGQPIVTVPAFEPRYPGESAPLVMPGGESHLRALMRTISASEANDPQPYTLLYGGSRIKDLTRHPDRCITIRSGPNRGDCTTAAGRYQFITTTWLEKAALYHPLRNDLHNRFQWLLGASYSFEPLYQDLVTYGWLEDSQAWGMDIEEQLSAGELQPVLKRLSGTWTSLGYGIEDNVVTPYLSEIYQTLLTQEQAQPQG